MPGAGYVVRNVEECDESESRAEGMRENEWNRRRRIIRREAARVSVIAEEYQRRKEQQWMEREICGEAEGEDGGERSS